MVNSNNIIKTLGAKVMTRKHFIILAKGISQISNYQDRVSMAKYLVPMLRDMNNRFKINVFLRACNIKESDYQ